jgi:hypothetical protein
MNEVNSATGKVLLGGAELEKALVNHQFDHASTQLVGMVKASSKQGHIAFTPSGCESWVDLPSDMIETAEHIGHQPCKDHSHPLFRLAIKEPSDPVAKAMLALLAVRPAHPHAVPAMAQPSMQPSMMGVAQANRVTGTNGAMAAPRCNSFCSGPTLWCVCYQYIPWLGIVTTVYPCGSCINDPVYTAFQNGVYTV